MWLRDGLPKDLPNSRIFTYSYDTQLQKSSSIQNLTDAGLALRTALNDFVQTTDVSSHPRRCASLREVTSVIQEGLKHSPRNNSMKKLENLTREMCRLLLVQDLFHS